MKNSFKGLTSFALVLSFGTVALSAQSCAAAGHAMNSVSLSAAASGEAVAAVGGSVVGSVKVVSGVAAVPLWMSGAAVSGVAALSAEAGGGAVKAADHLWDFASGEPAKRPHIDRERGVPPLKKAEVKPLDPSPAEAAKAKI